MEGIKDVKKEMAKKLIERNYSMKEITEIIGLSENELKEI